MTDPPFDCELDIEKIAETRAAVVFSRTCNASDGAFVAYLREYFINDVNL